MSTLLIPDWAINWFARVATTEDSSINERRQAIPTPTHERIQENFEVSAIPEDAVREITEGIKTRVRFNAVVKTGVPGFIPRDK